MMAWRAVQEKGFTRVSALPPGRFVAHSGAIRPGCRQKNRHPQTHALMAVAELNLSVQGLY